MSASVPLSMWLRAARVWLAALAGAALLVAGAVVATYWASKSMVGMWAHSAVVAFFAFAAGARFSLRAAVTGGVLAFSLLFGAWVSFV